MDKMTRRTAVVAMLLTPLVVAACDQKSPTQPGPPPPSSQYTVTGTVTSAANSSPIVGATVTVSGGPQNGRASTTDSSGRFTLSGLSFAGFQLSVTAAGHATVSQNAILTQGVTTATVNVSMLPAILANFSGSGNTVFDLPAYVTRVRVTGDFTGSSTNFIVRIRGRLVVNELLGTFWGSTRYDGTHLLAGTTGNAVEIDHSSGVLWTITEVR